MCRGDSLLILEYVLNCLIADDVKLSEVISPKMKHKLASSPKISKHEHLIFSDKDKAAPTETSSRLKVAVKIPEESEIPIIVEKDNWNFRKRLREETSSQSSSEGEDSFNSKFDYAVKTSVESPQGDFKLTINRTLKPKNSQKIPDSTVSQRISRRASLQLGISPGKILQLQTEKSPLPSSKKLNKNKENKFSPLSSNSLFDLTTSPILNMPNKGRRPSKDSPSRKRRRVSKKLYE